MTTLSSSSTSISHFGIITDNNDSSVVVVPVQQQQQSSSSSSSSSSQPLTTPSTMDTTITKSSSSYSSLRINMLLIIGQIFFGGGSVVAALGLPSCNPLAFAFYREIFGGLILSIISIYYYHHQQQKQEHQHQQQQQYVDQTTISDGIQTSMTTTNTTTSNTATTTTTRNRRGDYHLLAPNNVNNANNSDNDGDNNDDDDDNNNSYTNATTWKKLKLSLYLFLEPIRCIFYNNHNNNNKKKHLLRFFILGIAIFGNQAGYILGVKFSGPITASIWQPSQPILTVALSMIIMRWEPFNKIRLLGIIIAFLGCSMMIYLMESSKDKQSSSSSSFLQGNNNSKGGGKGGDVVVTTYMIGNFFLFCNCLFTSLYVMLSKDLLKIYPSITVTAWSYNIAALLMGITAFITSMSTSIMKFICPNCIIIDDNDGSNKGTGIWNIPSGAYFALIYFIVFVSVMGYGIMTWANRYATGTLVIGYTVLQPVTSALLSTFLLVMNFYPTCNSSTNSTQENDTSSSIIGSYINYDTTTRTFKDLFSRLLAVTFDSNTDNDSNLFVEEDLGVSSLSSSSQVCLDYPGWSAITGVIGVFIGLCLVIMTEPKKIEDDINQEQQQEEEVFQDDDDEDQLRLLEHNEI